MKKRIILVALCIVLASVFVVGCAPQAATESSSAPEESSSVDASAETSEAATESASDAEAVEVEGYMPEPLDRPLKIGFSNASVSNPWRVSMMDTMNYLASLYGEDLELITLDANDDPQKQFSDCEDLLQQGVDALLLAPSVSDALAPIVDRCNEMDVPIVVFDRTINNPDYTAYVATDNHLLAVPVAEYIVETWPDGANIVYLSGISGAGADTERTEGLESVIGDKPEYVILSQQDAYWNEADGLTVMENMLQSFKDIDIVLCSDGNTSIGALRAIEAAGRMDEMTVVCFDAWRADSLQNIEDGRIAPFTTMLGTYVGAVALQTAIDILNGKEPKSEDKYIHIPCPIITLDNLDEFWDRSLEPTEYSWKPAFEGYMMEDYESEWY